MKACSKCGTEKKLTEFHKDSSRKDGLRGDCKQCVYERRKQYCAEHKEQIEEYLTKNKERIRKLKKEYMREYYVENKERIKKYQSSNKKQRNNRLYKRYHSDTAYRLADVIRSRLRSALNGLNKAYATISTVGCSWQELRNYIESQFTPIMNWTNHGQLWHVDHIIPISYFVLTNPNTKCNHHTNLRPLEAKENISKSDTLPDIKTIYKILLNIPL